VAVVNREQRRAAGNREPLAPEDRPPQAVTGMGIPKKLTPEEDTEATEYVRELNDAQLVGLAVHVGQRVSALLAQGVNLPMQQVENHHLIGLLECFVGPEESMRVREWHLTWLDRKLDAVEAAQRMAVFTSVNGDAS
jgi:hypothetical protein